MAMTLVSTVTVGSGGAASIEFTGIAGTGKDLLLLCSLRSDSGGSDYRSLYMRFNNNATASAYVIRRLEGFGSAESSTTTSTRFFINGGVNDTNSTANTFSNNAIYVTNYAGSDSKSISVDNVAENNASSLYTFYNAIQAGNWTQTNAITSIQLESPSVNFAQHSTASLYIIS